MTTTATPGRRSTGRGQLLAAGMGGVLRRPRDLLKALLFALIVMNISRIHQHFPILSALRPGLLLIAGVTALAVLRNGFFANVPALKTWIARALIALAIVACLSAPFGISLGAAARVFTDNYGKVLFMAFLMLCSLRTVSDLWYLVWAYVVGCGLLTYLALFVFHPSSAGDGELMRLQGLYSYDGNDVCVVLLIGIPLTLLQLQTAQGRLVKVLTVVLLLGMGEVVAKSGSRGGFLGLVAVVLALLLLAKNVRFTRRLAFVGAVGLAVTLAAPEGYWNQMKTLLEPKADYNWNTAYGRREIWIRGMGYMKRYPLFGVGLGNFPRAEGTISAIAKNAPAFTPIRWVAPHNTFVQVGAELGVTGLLLFGSLVMGGTVGMLWLRERLPKPSSRASPHDRFLSLCPTYFMIAMVGFAVSGFFVSHAYMDHFYVLVSLMAGLWALVRVNEQIPAERRRKVAGWRSLAAPPVVLPQPSPQR